MFYIILHFTEHDISTKCIFYYSSTIIEYQYQQKMSQLYEQK